MALTRSPEKSLFIASSGLRISGQSLNRSGPGEVWIIGVAKERKAGILAAEPHRGHGLSLAILYNRRRKHGGVKVGVVL